MLAAIVIGRNVANVGEIEHFLHSFSTDNEQINKWLSTAMRKWILRSFDKEKPYHPSDTDPEWMKGKTDLVKLDLEEGNLHEQVEHIVDFMKAQVAANPQIKFENFQVDQAFKQAADWTARLQKKKTEEEVEGTDYNTIKAYDTGYKWIDVVSQNGLLREGKLMGHCVGGYYDRVKSGSVKILSLRDKKNEPHCTIELERGGRLNQIKGKQNGKVNKEYMDYVMDFINSKLVPFKKMDEYDMKRNGLLHTKEGYISVNNIKPGTVIEHDFNLKDFKDVELPEDLTVKGDLKVGDRAEFKKNLKVGGELDLSHNSISELPEGLDVKDLNIFDTNIRELPRGMKIRGSLIAKYSQLEKLPDNLKIAGDLDLSHTPLIDLPKKLKVGHELDLMETGITVLPDDLKVGKAIFMDDDWKEKVKVPKALLKICYPKGKPSKKNDADEDEEE